MSDDDKTDLLCKAVIQDLQADNAALRAKLATLERTIWASEQPNVSIFAESLIGENDALRARLEKAEWIFASLISAPTSGELWADARKWIEEARK